MREFIYWNATWVLIPMALAGVLHMFVVRFNLGGNLAAPIWSKGFGPHKTWRGILAMAVFGALGVTLLAGLSPSVPLPVAPWWWGGGLGLVYVVAELPNSWIKRRMGIPPGEQSARHPVLSGAADKLDSALLGALVLATWVHVEPAEFRFGPEVRFFSVFASSLILNSGIHALLSWLLVVVQLKKRF